MSSSWNDEASQTTVTSRGQPPSSVSDDAAVPTLPATATGSPASRWTCPIHSVVVVLPFVPVTATNSLRDEPPGQLELAEHGEAAVARRADRGRVLGYAGALDERPGAGGKVDA